MQFADTCNKKGSLLAKLIAGRDGCQEHGFAGVISLAGSKPGTLGRDVPALFEAYSLLEHAISCANGSNHQILEATPYRSWDGKDILPPGLKTLVIYSDPTRPDIHHSPRVALLKRISKGMLEYHAQWVSEIARSMPLMQGSGRKLGFDIKHSTGVLGLFYTEEQKGDLQYLMPDWYGAFWLDGIAEQCTAFPMLRSVLTQIPDDINWVESIAARIKDSGLTPTPRAWDAI